MDLLYPQFLFSYGTLQADKVIKAVIGRVPQRRQGVIRGYRCSLVRNQVYPGIIPQSDHQVEGCCFFGLSEAELQAIDRFESDLYQRETVAVMLSDQCIISAFVYVLKPQNIALLSDTPWDYSIFLARDLDRYV